MSLLVPLKRIGALLLFLGPIAYVGELFQTAVHEVMGHGLFALAVGGSFDGFFLKWDGMGGAFSSPREGAPPLHQIVILGGGVISNVIAGGLLLATALLRRTGFCARLALSICSIEQFLGGGTYVLWNAYHPVPPGDIGRILQLLSEDVWPGAIWPRWFFMIAGAGISIAATAGIGVLIWWDVERYLRLDTIWTNRKRAVVLLFLFALPGAVGWFLFDWDQLAPGVGLTPCFFGAGSMVATAAAMYFLPSKEGKPSEEPRIGPLAIALSWSALAWTILSMALWLEEGIRWA